MFKTIAMLILLSLTIYGQNENDSTALYSIGYNNGLELYRNVSGVYSLGVTITGGIYKQDDSTSYKDYLNHVGFRETDRNSYWLGIELLFKKRLASTKYFALDGVLKPAFQFQTSSDKYKTTYLDTFVVEQNHSKRTQYTASTYICAEPCFMPMKNVEIFWSASAGVDYSWASGLDNNDNDHSKNSGLSARFPSSIYLLNSVGVRLKFKYQ